ncbi:cytochrome P450 [Actinomadura algeriensis]|uniref:Cytochrome P450 n=1 Tax=Actinomadura algeriensis TaxID=1679523 RepID=A0ABR9JIZ7_9ACTN|nr:cytochrome P450 [Actinomadura algeriensis]MBE1530502.1 cytochrome P450 [Actinomadura algeriensis]
METTPPPYPFQRPSALDPPVELRSLRTEPVVRVTLPSGDVAWMVTRYEDVRALLADDRISRNLNRPGAARISNKNKLFQDPKMDPDPPEHTRVRRLVMKALTPARVERLRPRVQQITDEIVAGMLRRRPPVDLAEALAYPLPIRVVCELLGVPVEDQARFRGWTKAFLSIGGYTAEEIEQNMAALDGYMRELIDAKRAAPADDLISALIEVRDQEDGRLGEYELHWWARLLVLVGFETTAVQIGGCVAMLLSRPDQLELVREDPGLLKGAVEELLRWKIVGSSVTMLRYATEDVTVGGVTIPAGAGVIPAADSANQDDAVFDRPEVFDVTRTENPHLTFSHGTHYCAGASLARLELETVLSTLLREIPDLRLAIPAEQLRRHDGNLLESFVEIPVTWGGPHDGDAGDVG